MTPESSVEDDYVREAIPDLAVEDVAGRELRLADLGGAGAALLVWASTGAVEGRALLSDVVAQLAFVPHLRVVAVLRHRSEMTRIPPEVRRAAVIDKDGMLEGLWGDGATDSGAVLLGRDGLLAGGPVWGRPDVQDFAAQVEEAIRQHLPTPPGLGAIPAEMNASFSVDVLIPFRAAAPERLRNLTFAIGYYRRHLPDAKVIVAEQDCVTPLAPEVRPDLHLAVAGDEDLFNKSLLLNEAARHSTAAYLLIADADCIPDASVLAALEGLVATIPDHYVVLHDVVHYLTDEGTRAFIGDGAAYDGSAPAVGLHSSHQTVGGATLCSAQRYAQMAGFDQQRFLGWGGEDDDFYNRCLVTDGQVHRVPAGLLHLDHPATVWHRFTEEQMVEKRSRISPSRVVSPGDRLGAVQHFMADNRVAFATCSSRSGLFDVFRGFSQGVFPAMHVVDGSGGQYGSGAFLELFLEESLEWADYLVYSDEDNFIVDWACLQETLETLIAGGYGFAGMPDGGVISHRFHNPIAINPFLGIFDLRAVRAAFTGREVDGQYRSDLIGHWPSRLIRHWDGVIAYPRVCTVVEEGYVPYGAALDNFEPYYSLWFHLLRQGLTPLYLDARDAPEMDDDGGCTALLAPSGGVLAYHSWFARDYPYSPQSRTRINKVAQRALSHVRW